MVRTVTDYLEQTELLFPDKIAFADENREITFSELKKEAQKIATNIIKAGFFKNPIAVFLDKSVECVAAFEGISYSGNFYSPIDTQMPQERIEKIIGKLNPIVVITDYAHKDVAAEFAPQSIILCYEDLIKIEVDYQKISETTKRIIDSDVLYVLFTSGSTGTPKGAIISHRGMIDLTEWITNSLGFDSSIVMANQTPFYFSFSVYEIYQTLKNGCTTYIVPQKLFKFPPKLMVYLEEKKINTIIWVPSILTFISAMKSVNRPHLTHIKNIYFGAEVMPMKHLNKWIAEYPDVRFVNLFGPTEVTDTCTYFEVNRHFNDDEMLPIGQTCLNKDTFLLDEYDNLITKPNGIGEICVRGSGIAYGYYNDEEKTKLAFVQNPLNTAYHELIYRTGDLGKFNDLGEMVYVCRKDFQVKHKGHRIELGEIETAVSAIDGIEEQCCLYDSDKLRIVLFYVGNVDEKTIMEVLRRELPEYMLPGLRKKLDSMPKNLNGKTDRQRLKVLIEG